MSGSHYPSYWALIIVTTVLLLNQCAKSPTGDAAESDTTPPDIIIDLVVSTSTTHAVVLQWTAPYDHRNDQTHGFVDKYDLRQSYNVISEENFSQAVSANSNLVPAPAGIMQMCEIGNLEADSIYYFAIKSQDDKGNWSGISNCSSVHCPAIQEVTIVDTVLERVIREQINKPDGPILSCEIDTLSIISAPWEGVKNLTGLEYCVSLRSAVLPGNEITDISPLAYATYVWGLELTDNSITDLSPLAGLNNLHQLHISQNPIVDIGPLAQLPALQQLFMYATGVTDFSPLYELEHLDDIHFGILNLTDISFISNLVHLRICNLGSNHINSITPLSGLVELVGLDLQINEITDISPLAGLTNLQSLFLGENGISDIQPLVDNTGLATGDIVHLDGNPLSQESTEQFIPALEARGVEVFR